jgi:hypothetical protein
MSEAILGPEQGARAFPCLRPALLMRAWFERRRARCGDFTGPHLHLTSSVDSAVIFDLNSFNDGRPAIRSLSEMDRLDPVRIGEKP